MVYGTCNYSYWGESKPTNITRGPHIVMIALVRYYWYKLCTDIYHISYIIIVNMYNIYIYTKWGPQTIAKLLYNSNVTMVYGTYNYSYWGESKPTNITRGPHIVMIALVRYYWYKLCIDIYIYICISPRCCTAGATPPSTSAATSSHQSATATRRATARCSLEAQRRPPAVHRRASPWENFHHEKWWKKWGQTMKYPLNMGEIWWIYRIFKCLSEILVVFTQ